MYDNWEQLKSDCMGCMKCELGKTRTKLVFGVGNENAKVLFIGEGPGANEDLQGEPFVGRGGQLLDKFLAAVDLDRKKNIYAAIGNSGNVIYVNPEKNIVIAVSSYFKPTIFDRVDFIEQKVLSAIEKGA